MPARARAQRRPVLIALVLAVVVMACEPPVPPGSPVEGAPPLPANAGPWLGSLSFDGDYSSVGGLDWRYTDVTLTERYTLTGPGPFGTSTATFSGSYRQETSRGPFDPLYPRCSDYINQFIIEATGTAPAEVLVAVASPEGDEAWQMSPHLTSWTGITATITYVDLCGNPGQVSPIDCDPYCGYFGGYAAIDPDAAFNPNATSLVGSNELTLPGQPCCVHASWALSRITDIDGDGTSDEDERDAGSDPLYPEGASPVEAYAPVVYVYPQERYLPTSTEDFIENSELSWSLGLEISPLLQGLVDCGSDVVADRHEIVPSFLRLGAGSEGAYPHDARGRGPSDCSDFTSTAYAKELTAPYQNDDNPAVDEAEGFYLDVDSSEYSGMGTQAPIYYLYEDQKFISYWFFYAYNKLSVQDHEGDWENVVVRLNCDNRATEIAFSAHGDPTPYPWPLQGESPVSLQDGSHPIVFSAKGSHASYPTTGDHDIPGVPVDDKTAFSTPAWDARGNLLSLKSQPWWGYNGGWGGVDHNLINGAPLRPADFSGPIGPNPDGNKDLAPPGWDVNDCPA